jgi:hypothetical protein
VTTEWIHALLVVKASGTPGAFKRLAEAFAVPESGAEMGLVVAGKGCVIFLLVPDATGERAQAKLMIGLAAVAALEGEMISLDSDIDVYEAETDTNGKGPLSRDEGLDNLRQRAMRGAAAMPMGRFPIDDDGVDILFSARPN